LTEEAAATLKSERFIEDLEKETKREENKGCLSEYRRLKPWLPT